MQILFGKVNITIPNINYGEIKEIRYDMEVLDPANRKK